MIRRLLIFLTILLGLLALADRGMAVVAGNSTAEQIRIREGLKEDPQVTFRGFPFVTQAVRGKFSAVDVTVRDLVRQGLTIDRIDAHLEGVEVDLGDALEGRVVAVPVNEGEATVRVTYGDLQSFLGSKPGNIRIVVRNNEPRVVSSFGIPGVGAVDVEGTPTVSVVGGSVRVTVSNMRTLDGNGLAAALATQAAARASFSIPLGELPFGITVRSATLTDTAVVVEASAKGLVIDVS